MDIQNQNDPNVRNKVASWHELHPNTLNSGVSGRANPYVAMPKQKKTGHALTFHLRMKCIALIMIHLGTKYSTSIN